MSSEQKLEIFELQYESGQTMYQDYLLNGKREGKARSWFENGRLGGIHFFKNGMQEGKSIYWHGNGVLLQKVNFRNGKYEGEYTTYNTDGYPLETKFFRDGTFISRKFTVGKKRIFLRIRRNCFGKIIPTIDTFLIPDLADLCFSV
jgi:antitoxin component YwqK of YwqJK toxin-antitoxin module